MFEQHQVGLRSHARGSSATVTPFCPTYRRCAVAVIKCQGEEEALGGGVRSGRQRGANLAVVEVRSLGELLFRERFDGVWLASAACRFIWNSMRSEGRAKEMAQAPPSSEDQN